LRPEIEKTKYRDVQKNCSLEVFDKKEEEKVTRKEWWSTLAKMR